MKLPEIAIKNYQFTLIVFLLLVIWGVDAYVSMPRMENPSVYIPGANIIAVYPGASPSDMESLIAIPLEEAINELDDIKKVNTGIQDGLAILTVEFTWGKDADKKYSEVVRKVNTVRGNLPEDIYLLEVNQFSSSDVDILHLAVVSDSFGFQTLERTAEKLKKKLEKVYGIRKAEIIACPDVEVRIALDLQKMSRMNISLDQIGNAIKSTNANIPGGAIDISGKSFAIKTSGSYKELDEIKNTVINSYMGKLVYLKNIADVDFAYQESKYLGRSNGKRAVFLTAQQKEGINIFEIFQEVHPLIESFRKETDPGVGVEYVFDQSIGVDSRINGFLNNLFQGIVLVGLVILFVLGFRSSAMVMFAIPLSIIIGLGIVAAAGFGLEQISIAGLVVALGLLVDNSIVIIENINRFIAMGYSTREAAIRGTAQIGWPIISSTVTTLLAFIPIIMMPDKAGDFIRTLPLTIIATLSISLLVALTLTPMVASKVFKGHMEGKKTGRATQVLNNFVEGPYHMVLNFVMRKKMLTIGVSLGIMIFSGYFFMTYMGISFFPNAESPNLLIQVNLPKGTSMAKTDSVAHYVESVIDTISDIKAYTTNVGHGNPRIYYNVYPKNFTNNFAEIYVELHEYEMEKYYRLIEKLRLTFNGYPGAQINVKEFTQGIPVTAPIMIYVSGEQMKVLRKISTDVENMLISRKGAVNIQNDLSQKRTDLAFKINKEKAGLLGVPIFEIDKTIRIAVSGMEVSTFRDAAGKEYSISIRMASDRKISIDEVENIFVKSLSGKMIPLGQLATLQLEEAPTSISRRNFERTALVTADVIPGESIDDIMGPIMEELEKYPFPAGYDYYIAGEIEARNETFGGMGNALIIAIIAIFAVLVLQFRSFVQPIIIFVSIPFSFIGMIWALYFSGYTFSFTAFIGLISLIGIVINNAIILVDYANKLRTEGMPLEEAIKESAKTRFTPIILTSLTTIGGLLPLTLQGGLLWAPLGWTIIGGLFASTFLSLLLVPVFYKIFGKTLGKDQISSEYQEISPAYGRR